MAFVLPLAQPMGVKTQCLPNMPIKAQIQASVEITRKSSIISLVLVTLLPADLS